VARVAVNAVANAAAFGLVAALNLVTVPVLLSAYGLTGYGVIVLARLFLPTNVLGLFDFGLPEAVTRYVARARATGESAQLRPVIGRVVLYAAGTGAVLAALFGATAGMVARWLAHGDGAQAAALESALLWTACFLVLMFPGLIFESIIKGTEQYVAIRSSEVVVAAAYLVGVLGLISRAAGYEHVVLLFVVLTSVRYVFCAAYAWWRCAEVFPDYRNAPERTLLVELRRHGATVFAGKVLSIVFAHGGSLLIAKLVSVAGVGIFDALTRIPRFLKNAFNMTNAVILPASSRLDARGETGAIRRMLKIGTSVSAAASLPVILGVGIYADAILAHWLGRQYADLAGWLATFLVWSALTTIIGVGSQMILARRAALAKLYRLSTVQLVIHFATSLALAGWLEQFAFVVGTAAATALVFPLVVDVICREYGLSAREYYGLLFRLLVAALPSVLWLLVSAPLDLTASVHGLAASFTIWLGLYWTLVYVWVWSDDERRWLRGNVAAFRATLLR
jgi:O-antigen/teichoic acid export membrane protein